MKRRDFLKTAVAVSGGMATGDSRVIQGAGARATGKPITVVETNCDFEREPLLRPFGFKGGYMTEIWQSAAMIRSTSGKRGIGLCTHSTLWSDAKVFASNSPAAGDALMFAMTDD